MKTSQSGQDTITQLVQWYVDHGGFIHPALELVDSSAHGLGMRIREDAQGLKNGTVVLKCPHTTSLSFFNVAKFHPSESHSEPFPDIFLQEATPRTATVFFLIHQYLMKERSFWWPYIRTLPQPDELDRMTTPLWFSEEDKVWLKGTNLEKGASDRIDEWRREWMIGKQMLNSADWNIEGYTWPLALWAATILSSRSFASSYLLARDKMPSEIASEDSLGDMCSVLFPVLDTINHRPRAPMAWIPGEGSFSFKVTDDLHQGSELWNDYGPKGNEERYGFCIANNKYDFFGLKLSATPLSHAQQSIRERQTSYQSNTLLPNGYYFVRGSQHVSGVYPNAEPELCAFPYGLLDVSAILVANEREMAKLAECPDVDWFSRRNAIGWRNKFAIMSQFLLALRRQYQNIISWNSMLPGKPMNQRQEYAKIYRDGQLDILEETTERLQDRLHNAMLTSLEGRDHPAKLLTLEDALNCLKYMPSPHPFLNVQRSFKEGIQATIGACSVSELREAGWEEDILVLWLCTVRICLHERPASKEGLSRIEHVTETESQLENWLNSLMRLGVYGDPMSNSNSLPKYRTSFDSNTESETDGDETDPIMSRVISLFKIVQEAAESSAIFNLSGWSTGLIRWAVTIVEEEGLKVVLDDDADPSTGGQYVLCIEGEEGLDPDQQWQDWTDEKD
ncbi:MAG: hypothetical protein M1816_001723 [Peltula sp. TS41687]|nr:MAG: hypothetical protein M1816_001723 [Peltula sp. TS41687]